MNIGEVARRSGLPAKTIRYYDEIGLVVPARRTAAGYRDYDARDLETLRFVQRARSLGFAVEDVRALLALWRDRARSSSEVKALARHHLEAIESKIAALTGLRDTLEHLVERCHGDTRPDCPILERLAGEDD